MRYPTINNRELSKENKKKFRDIKRIVKRNINLYVSIAKLNSIKRIDIECLSHNVSFGILCDLAKKGK